MLFLKLIRPLKFLNSMRECIIRENGSSIFATGLNGETEKVDYFLGGDAGNEAPRLWL